ncbi:hypothetical protein J6590_022861 [Homalodisca vitripennis]|nr:hypothetical protein J6590_022861 [Homalodisca vitripennis]
MSRQTCVNIVGEVLKDPGSRFVRVLIPPNFLCIFSSLLSNLTDTDSEHRLVREVALAAGAYDAVVCSHWNEGGKGAVGLADAVIQACQSSHHFQFLYDLNQPLLKKMEKVAFEMYGAGEVKPTPQVLEKLQLLEQKVILWFYYVKGSSMG